jgi:hypothetical protein
LASQNTVEDISAIALESHGELAQLAKPPIPCKINRSPVLSCSFPTSMSCSHTATSPLACVHKPRIRPVHAHCRASSSPSKIQSQIGTPNAVGLLICSPHQILVVMQAGQAPSPSPSSRLSVDRLLLMKFFALLDLVTGCPQRILPDATWVNSEEDFSVRFFLLCLVRCKFTRFRLLWATDDEESCQMHVVCM